MIFILVITLMIMQVRLTRRVYLNFRNAWSILDSQSRVDIYISYQPLSVCLSLFLFVFICVGLRVSIYHFYRYLIALIILYHMTDIQVVALLNLPGFQDEAYHLEQLYGSRCLLANNPNNSDNPDVPDSVSKGRSKRETETEHRNNTGPGNGGKMNMFQFESLEIFKMSYRYPSTLNPSPI